MKTVLTVIFAVAACGGAPKGSSTSPDDADRRNRGMSHMGGDHQMGGAGHMGKMGEQAEAGMPPQLAKFHDTLAPHWHAAQGPQRMADTCAALPELHRDAEAISAAEAPRQGDAVAWSTGGKKLTEAVAALGATCRNKDADAFEPAFARVHEIFHGLTETAGVHDEHGKGEHDDDDSDDDHGDDHDEHH
jgi:hypothetical protein